MAFALTDTALRRLCQVNSFEIPADRMVLFGLRGCIPAAPDEHQFQTEQVLQVATCDYVHPRCTLGQWLPASGTLAVFPGSTVPHGRYVRTSLEKAGKGTNQMMEGYYGDYRKGHHKAGHSTAHDAFRQTEAHPVRRTADDFDFDNDDRVEFMNPYDNIHAGWSMGLNHNSYASAGCQVVVGFPQCAHLRNEPARGPWGTFKENAYSLPQVSFPYVLLTGMEAERVVLVGSQPMKPRVRFGSAGPLVEGVQRALQQRGFYEGSMDGAFKLRTTRAVLEFQSTTFGSDADDGIVGPITASALGLLWPEL